MRDYDDDDDDDDDEGVGQVGGADLGNIIITLLTEHFPSSLSNP